MGEPEVPWSQYDTAYKRIHDAIISSIVSPPTGKKITKNAFTWNTDGTLATLRAYDGNDLLFTLTFTWNPDCALKEISRS
jgi:hypothetical protein